MGRDAYELEVPGNLKVFTTDGAYELTVEEIIKEQCHCFHCVTSYEDYNYVLEQYVKNQMHMFSNEVKVLLLFYDEQLGLHVTMPIRVRIDEVSHEVSIADASYWVNRRISTFQDWCCSVNIN